MTRTELAASVNGILVELCGEQFTSVTAEDGDVLFGVPVRGVPVGLIVERLWDDEPVLAGHHVIGARIEDLEAAAEYVAQRNQQIRIGRVELIADSVVIFHHLFAAGVNKDTVRHLLGLLAQESRTHADLAEATGALRLADVAALDDLGEA